MRTTERERILIMRKKKSFCAILLSLLTLMASAVIAHAETFHFDLDTSYANNMEYAVLTATDLSGTVRWTYTSDYYPAAQLSHFALVMNDHGGIYLVEDGAIKAFDFYTGNVKWTNPDFKGSPAKGCYAFSSSDKLYIAGYLGPDLFVVDKDGSTICRVDELLPGSYWPVSMTFEGGASDNMTIHYESDGRDFTFNVLDYFNRRDGLDASGGSSSGSAAAGYTAEELCVMAQSYYDRHNGYYPPLADVDSYDAASDTYTIHLYEFVQDEMGGHTATSAWYQVNSQGIGTDVIFGTAVDLSN